MYIHIHTHAHTHIYIFRVNPTILYREKSGGAPTLPKFCSSALSSYHRLTL